MGKIFTLRTPPHALGIQFFGRRISMQSIRRRGEEMSPIEISREPILEKLLLTSSSRRRRLRFDKRYNGTEFLFSKSKDSSAEEG